QGQLHLRQRRQHPARRLVSRSRASVPGPWFLGFVPRGVVESGKVGQFVADFVKREDGPTAVEYAVMLALIIVVCLVAITALGTKASSTFVSVANTLPGGS